MAITHTETVSNLTVLNDGSDVVSEVTIKTVSVDDSDPTNLTIESVETYPVDTSGGSSAEGFVAFGSLSFRYAAKQSVGITSDPTPGHKTMPADKAFLSH